MTTSNNNGIWQDTFQLTSVPVLSDVAVIFWISIVVSTQNGKFLGSVTTAFSKR